MNDSKSHSSSSDFVFRSIDMANRYGSTEANGLLEEESAFSVRKQPSYARKTKTVSLFTLIMEKT